MNKELEALERLYDNLNVNDYFFRDDACEDYATIEKSLKALEIIKELILEDLVFDDKEQKINFSFGISTLCIKIENKTKYDLLKEGLLWKELY